MTLLQRRGFGLFHGLLPRYAISLQIESRAASFSLNLQAQKFLTAFQVYRVFNE